MRCPFCRGWRLLSAAWQWIPAAIKKIFRNKFEKMGEEMLRQAATETPIVITPPPPPATDSEEKTTWLLYKEGSDEAEIVPVPARRSSTPPPPAGQEGKVVGRIGGKKN